jgi:putative holliday junction resolvase
VIVARPPAKARRVPAAGRVLGVDLGTKRIGVAISDSGQQMATGLTVLTCSGEPAADRRALARLADDEGVVAVVVGMPRSLDGSMGPVSRAAQAQVALLQHELHIPVETQDERLSTVTASRALRAGGIKSRGGRKVIDQVAAAVILQSWLDARRYR